MNQSEKKIFEVRDQRSSNHIIPIQDLIVEAFDRRVATLDLPSLIQAKRATGREKDLSALPELESLLEGEEPE